MERRHFDPTPQLRSNSHIENSKNHKRWYYPSLHRLSVYVLLNNIPFYDFAFIFAIFVPLKLLTYAVRLHYYMSNLETTLFPFSVWNLLSQWFSSTSVSYANDILAISQPLQIYLYAYSDIFEGLLTFTGLTWPTPCQFQIHYTPDLEWAKAKLCTKFEVSSFTGFQYILEDMPNFLGVTWPRPRLLWEILYCNLCILSIHFSTCMALWWILTGVFDENSV